jgi:GAF domain-containing protein
MAASEKTIPTRDPRASLQEREVHRYYQPWLSAQGSSLNVASHVAGIGQNELSQQGYRPKASEDKALVAFAQLAVLRFNVKRAMVSLIDSRSQMILAEASSSLSLTASDELWLGSTVLPRSAAICEHCLISTCTAQDADGQTYMSKGLIVNDCRLDQRFQDRSFVAQEPGVRFYAGIPIQSMSGHLIGVYAVSDDAPRDGLRTEELCFMEQTARAVMEHLEWVRTAC